MYDSYTQSHNVAVGQKRNNNVKTITLLKNRFSLFRQLIIRVTHAARCEYIIVAAAVHCMYNCV